MRASAILWCAALLLAASCVRLSDTGEFVCKADADCPSNYKCALRGAVLRQECVPLDYCEGSSDCPPDRRCANEHCIVPECTSGSSTCHPYACDPYSYRCQTTCTPAYGCGGGFLCSAGVCVAASPTPLQNGATCSLNGECASGMCCLNGSLIGTCQADCTPPANGPCASDFDCSIGAHCCPVANQTEKVCQGTACVLGLNGDPCASDDYCASGFCSIGSCAMPIGDLGDVCTLHNQCASELCCPSGASATEKVCAEECATLTGDYCDIDLDVCSGGGYCYTYSADYYDGYCSAECTVDEDCGYNSTGWQNLCIDTGAGYECKPGCGHPLLQCEDIHSDLFCVDFDTQSACEF